MATIIKRANGTFQVRVRVKFQKPISKCFRSKQSAQRWAIVTEDAVKRGVYEYPVDAPAIPTLAKALKKYLKEITPRKKGADVEAYVINSLMSCDLATKTLDEITTRDVTMWRDRLLANKSPSTVNKRLSLLSHLFRVAVSEWGLALPNPCNGVIKPIVKNVRERVVSESEFDDVLSAIRDTELQVIVKLARYTAMRLGEVITAKWENLDYARSVLFLPDTKNGDSRTVPLSPKAIATIKEWEQASEGEEQETLFKVGRQQASKRWADAVKKARGIYEKQCEHLGRKPERNYLIDLHLHDLRHSAISELANAGLNTLELSRISGHKTVAMLSRYVHLKPEQLAQKLAALEAA